jgi:hypothetical protein
MRQMSTLKLCTSKDLALSVFVFTSHSGGKAKLGFFKELIVLYAESIGIKTCWMGYYKKRLVMAIVYTDYPYAKDMYSTAFLH